MKYTTLGKSDLKVSKACLGCMGFGAAQAGMHSWTLGEEESREIIKYALDKGINFFDTAAAYQGGTSEEYLGRAIRDFAKRDEVVIATKFLPLASDSAMSVREYVLNSIYGSLQRLGMDYVDLYIMHAWDNVHPIEEYLEVLNEIVKSGKSKYMGISNCCAWQLSVANGLARSKGYPEFISVQGHYNLIFREEEREMLPYCAYEGIAITPYSSLASGRLSRKPGEVSKRLEQDAYAKGKYDATAEVDSIIINRVAELAEKRGVTMSEIALAWNMAKTTSPVVGATKLHHIDGPVKACEIELSDEEMKYLEEPYVVHELVGMMSRKK